MMTDILSKGISAFVNFLAHSRDKKSQQREQSIRDLSAAVVETRIYLQSQKRGKPQDFKREEELARLWAQAAISCRHCSKEWALVDEAFDKCQYWLDNPDWSLDRIVQSGIQIEEMERKLLNLMH